MRVVWALVLSLSLAVSGCGKSSPPEEAAKEKPQPQGHVVLTQEQLDSLGLKTVPAQASQFRSGISGYGVVLALDTIGQLDSDFLSAQAVAAQSQAAANRARYLFSVEGGAVSRESMEAAQSKAAADQAALALTRRKAEAVFGHNAPWEKNGSRQAIMARLAAGSSALVRVTFPLGSLTELPSALSVAHMGTGSRRWSASSVWEAPADPGFPGPGILALVDGSSLAQNDHVIATVPVGAPVDGVTVPATAIVYSEDRAWVYRQDAPRDFSRIPVNTAQGNDGGYFVPQSVGLRPGTPVVVDGAGLLLARERNPSTEAAE